MHGKRAVTLESVHAVVAILTTIPGLLAAAGILFCALALWAAREFARAQRSLPREHPDPPPVSILKAVKGLDPGLARALRTHCTQDYPAPPGSRSNVALLIAVRSLYDPAVPLV